MLSILDGRDLQDKNVYDFEQISVVNNWIGYLRFEGRMRIRPYKVYEKWIENKEEV